MTRLEKFLLTALLLYVIAFWGLAWAAVLL